jgi:hypothetical protein
MYTWRMSGVPACQWKLGLELRTVVGLDHVHAEREASHHLVEKVDRRALIARIEHLQDADPRAVIDRRELIQALPRAGIRSRELHIDLQAMPRLAASRSAASASRAAGVSDSPGKRFIPCLPRMRCTETGATDT